MPRIVRYDDQELICRKESAYRPWGAVVVAINAWLLFFGRCEPWGTSPYPDPVAANPATYFVTFLLLVVGLLMLGWSELRIDFAKGTYRLVSELDWLAFHPRGQEGSCDEIDHLQVEFKPGGDPQSPQGWISLVWKDARRPPYLLGLAGLDMVRVIDGVPRFKLQRSDLPGRLASQLKLRVEVIGVEEEWLNPSEDSRPRLEWGEADSAAGASG